jgi:hypothetical protein
LGDTGQAERKRKRVIDEHSGIRDLKHRWDEEDKTRYELERQAQRAFLEQEANELFAPLENYLTRLDKVLHQANAAVEIDPTWEHLDERKLRRTAKVILRETAQHLPLDLTIDCHQGAMCAFVHNAARLREAAAWSAPLGPDRLRLVI